MSDSDLGGIRMEKTMIEIPRLRTMKEAHRYILEQDMGNAISFTLIRQLVISNKVAHLRSGKKYLVDVGDLVRYLQDELTPKNEQDLLDSRPVQR